MDNYRIYLETQLQYLDKLEKRIERSQRYLRQTPEGKFRVSKCRGTNQYYFHENGKECERYLNKSEQDLARRLAQRDYNSRLLRTLQKNRHTIKHFLQYYDESALEDVYRTLHDGRKALITPILKTTEEQIAQWYTEHPGGQNDYPIINGYETNQGELVRSKSEKILADLFFQMGIPYQYEPFLELHNGCIYPDFALFHTIRKDTCYWEHFGLLDSPEYAAKNFLRLDDYEQSGYQIGKNVLFSQERNNHPLDIRFIEKKLQAWLET